VLDVVGAGSGEVRATLRLRELRLTVPEPVRLSVRVAAGETVAVAAAPATGTALARVVVGLARPASGRVHVGTRDVTDEPPLTRQVGYVPAGGALLPHLTINDNVRYGLRRRETVQAETERWVDRVLDALELRPTRNLHPHQLSAAQRMRAALARATVCLPEVLVLDLPDGGEVLVELARQTAPDGGPGPAVLALSADPAVWAVADRVVRAGGTDAPPAGGADAGAAPTDPASVRAPAAGPAAVP
jgi:ABC-type ATPase involved in cell division